MQPKYPLTIASISFFEKSNPWALHAVCERLLEAHQRGLWAQPAPETLEALRQTLLNADSMLEGRQEEDSQSTFK